MFALGAAAACGAGEGLDGQLDVRFAGETYGYLTVIDHLSCQGSAGWARACGG